jgi:hypothetical protein
VSCLIGALVPLGARAQPQARPVLHLHPVDIGRDGSGIAFAEPDGLDVEGGSPQLDDTTAHAAFAVGLDLSDLRWAEDCRCLRHYIVYVRPRGSQTVTRFKVRGRPTGRFPDHWEDVAFDVEWGGVRDSGTLRLPVEAQQSNADELVQANRDAIQPINLHGERHLWFQLTNALSDTALDVNLPPTVRSDDDGVLKVWSTSSTAPTLKIEPGKTREVEVIVRPNPLAAARASLRPSLPTRPHAMVQAEFTYTNPVVQGRDDSLTAVAHVRFTPDPFVLFLALVLGVLLGCTVAFLVPRLAPRRMGRLRAFGIALAIGTVLELVGMFLVANDSRFVLFGFDLDPWQTLPTALVGIGVGVMGTRAAELLPFLKGEAKA